MGGTLDKIDKAILFDLAINCRISYRSLARKTGLSPNGVKYRIERLVEEGVIIRFVVDFSLNMIDADHYLAFVLTDGTESIQEFVSFIGESPMVNNVNVLGSVDGGAYLVYGYYLGSIMLAELGAFLRGFDEVQDVELHTLILIDEGSRFEFSKLHLKILKCLSKDARMQINEIAQMTGMAPKTVRRGLKELSDSQGVRFTTRFDLAAGGLVDAFVRINWNDTMISADELVQWLRDEYPLKFWYQYISATDSIMWADIVVGSLLEVEQISSRIRSAPFVRSTATIIASSNVLFEKLTEIKLKEMLENADL
ncbi:MAG: Lrp/AsnC family transcriptional regulator [Candidatus Thorarchaeota archaeon]